MQERVEEGKGEHGEKEGEIRQDDSRDRRVSTSCYEAVFPNLVEPLGISNISVEIYISALQFLMGILLVKESGLDKTP